VTPFGEQLPDLAVQPPGPASRSLAARLRTVESRNITWLADDFPVFWAEAKGANVRDADGNVFLDLTGAFGVALAGHGHPHVTEALHRQAGRLLHGMGDVHPPTAKVELLDRLTGLAPWEGAKGVLASTGSEAVEIALKTALVATGRPGVLAFEDGYHGLTLGSLATTARPLFRDDFATRLYPGVAFAPFPGPGSEPDEAEADEALARVAALLEAGAPNGDPIGSVILEPVQGRAGVRIPPEGFLAEVARLAREQGALVIADEILTGVGRCGAPLASTRLGLVPDLLCVGKALGGGMPMSACLGRPEVMDAWPPSAGEAIHTSTYLGHPGACATSLAMLDLLDQGLPHAAEEVGSVLLAGLRTGLSNVPDILEIRGLGALIGLELRGPDAPAARIARRALSEGLLLLPAGSAGHVLELLPSAYLTEAQTDHAIDLLVRIVQESST